jgi:hypothetical protein
MPPGCCGARKLSRSALLSELLKMILTKAAREIFLYVKQYPHAWHGPGSDAAAFEELVAKGLMVKKSRLLPLYSLSRKGFTISPNEITTELS